ncbi:thioredoxin-disulfide reductase [Rubritalea profundi]|uniref:Thioredoxin reductase n=1 Tax=Rubritalea profundi TaxID=1658618 RepID=A0A2S7U5R8_9BACT|nr:thioredoxin-disulfide reductase [Rubritalea profundi]PQJ29791.1 thioredoxin-disulfide reductase [Rubritalea profundi]
MENVIIIGTGPAGYTAAIYTARADLSPLILTGSQPGGQLTTTTDVENFPGFPDGIMGPELMQKMQQQAEKFGARVQNSIEVTSVDKNADGSFTVNAKDVFGSNEHVWQTKTVIIASGASARYLGLPGEMDLVKSGAGLTACATCDGAFYRDVPVCVIGGGDSAAEEASFLTKFASKVYLIHRRDELRASKIMATRALANEKIEPVWNSTICEYLLDDNGRIRAVMLENTVDGTKSELELEGVFMAIGHNPNSKFLSEELVDKDESGYLVQIPGKTATKTPGIYAAGDIADTVYRQGITAAGQGCAAALEAEHYIASL